MHGRRATCSVKSIGLTGGGGIKKNINHKRGIKKRNNSVWGRSRKKYVRGSKMSTHHHHHLKSIYEHSLTKYRYSFFLLLLFITLFFIFSSSASTCPPPHLHYLLSFKREFNIQPYIGP